MNKTLLVLFALLTSILTYGQEFLDKGTLAEIMEFELAGYTILDTTTGDLNRDTYPDLVLIYELSQDRNDEDYDYSTSRPLLIYTGLADGKFILKAYNFKTVLCSDCGGVFGDPYEQVVIKNGYFTVEHYGGSSWRWTRNITYTYDAETASWHLHMDASDSYHVFEPEEVDESRRTKKDFGTIGFEEFDIDEL